ncbi:MAG: CBS and ACT domain-containing protein [Desulfarculaceae bacterium]|nr:CBS and ACT domain-containing protein [Desulfarculaceae bacterium]MCF8074315.1 CBS and ACT domain-containing protein [Desulfarculaceae bacterium]MCF8103383.1 CBS and ACT domain-containing protein [Desulfarculaceae bacterium]MCF8117762.1 CBS and ACT domain-containing protein [Desulfarculaceae bacterium]
MLVANWMSSRLVTIDPAESLPQANKLMLQHGIRRLPVVDKKSRLVGILTDRDIKQAWASDATTLEVHELAYLLSRISVKEVMTPRPITITPTDTIEEAAEIMLEKKISGLPVIEDGQCMAMITQSDIFRALVLLTGVTKGGMLFAFNLPDEAGSIKRVGDIIRSYGGRMVSILSTSDRTAEGRRQVYIRMRLVDRDQLEPLRRKLSAEGELLYILDSREGRKELIMASQPMASGAAASAALDH